VSFGFLVAGFLATTNAGRIAVAAQERRAGRRSFAAAIAAGAGVVVAGALAADPLLEALDVSPESWRIAAGIVLGAAGVRTIIWPAPAPPPFAAVLVTPELAAVAVSFGADDPTGKVLAAAAVALLAGAVAYRTRRRSTSALIAQLLAALQIVIAAALAVAGIRDV
jgi:small neutral amino acid transporter SnatA (MarC family)